MREELAKRAEELGLREDEADLLADLLGWNISTTKQVPPLSHRGLKIYAGLDWYEPDTAERIKVVCEKLLGDRLVEATTDPDKFFYDNYTRRTMSRGVGTLLCQLDITTSDVDYSSLTYTPPEGLYRSFMRVVAFLLVSKENHGKTKASD